LSNLREELQKGPKLMTMKDLGNIKVWWVLDEQQAEAKKVKGPYLTCKELQYAKATTRPTLTLKVICLLKAKDLKVTVDPWAESKDSVGWTVLMTMAEGQKFRSLLRLLRRSKIAVMENKKLQPAPGEEETYQELRPLLEQFKAELVAALQRTSNFFSAGKQNNTNEVKAA